MEIDAGRGIGGVFVGEERSHVERHLGPATGASSGSRAVYGTDPSLIITYSDTDTVELVEAAPHDANGEQVFYGGVQLTFRIMDDVVADLKAKGSVCTPSDIGYDFEAGFAVFSMSSVSAHHIDPSLPVEDERLVVEGVAVAPYDYFLHSP